MARARLASVQRLIGVTRIARVTTLDRTGVEVACAVRPGGHVLQVSNGKGDTFAHAAWAAVGEAAELWAAEQVDPKALVWGSPDELSALHPVWGPGEVSAAARVAAPELWGRGARYAFRPVDELVSGRRVLVPAQALHCPPRGGPALGPCFASWISNGMGAHPRWERALIHALLEAIERDQLARALPQGWTEPALRARKLERSSLSAAPLTAARVAAIERGGFEVHLFDLTPNPSLGLPVAGALLFDREGGPVPLTAGYACAFRRDDALHAAVLEAAQSRVTDIHGAREDVALAPPAEVQLLRQACAAAPARRSAAELPDVRVGSSPVRALLARLRAAGFDRVAAVDLAPQGAPLHVARVILPGLLASELL